jgi:hypothetical protein
MTARATEGLRRAYALIRLDQFRNGVWGASLEASSAFYGRPADPGSISVSVACSLALSALSGGAADEPVERFRKYLVSRRHGSGGFGMMRPLGSARYPLNAIQVHARHTASAIRFFLHHDGVLHQAVTSGTQFLLDSANRTPSGLWVDHGANIDTRVDPVTVSAVVGCLEAVRGERERRPEAISLEQIDEAITLGLSHLPQSNCRLPNGQWIYRSETGEERERLSANSFRYTAGILSDIAPAVVRTGIARDLFAGVAEGLMALTGFYGGGIPAGPASAVVSFDATANLLRAHSSLSANEGPHTYTVGAIFDLFHQQNHLSQTMAPDWAALVHLASAANVTTGLPDDQAAELDAMLERFEVTPSEAALANGFEALRPMMTKLLGRRRQLEGDDASAPQPARALALTGYTNIDRQVIRVRNDLLADPGVTAIEVSAVMEIVRVLGNLAGAAVQDALYPAAVDEAAFQRDVRQRLRSNASIGSKLEEQARSTGGRYDLSYCGIRIELKSQSRKRMLPADCAAFAEQAASYAVGSGSRVAVLCILDASGKTATPFPVEDGIFVQPVDAGTACVHVVTLLIQGGLARPSDLSRKRRRTNPH